MIKKIAFLLFLAVVPSYGSVLISTWTEAPTSPVTTGYSSFTITVPGIGITGGINRAIVVGCNHTSGSVALVSSMTVNDFAMTRATSAISGVNATDLYVSTNVVLGVNYISIFHSGTISNAHRPCGAIALENVLLSSPIDVSTAAIGNIGGVLGFTTTSSSGMIVSVAGHGDSAVLPTMATGETVRWAIPMAFRVAAGGTKPSGNAGAKTVTWTTVSNNGMSAVHIKAASNTPEISSTTPASRGQGQGSFTLTVTGTGFVSGSSVTWDGELRATTFVNSQQVTAVILSTDTATIATRSLRVINPSNARTDSYSLNVTGDITTVWAGDGGYKPPQEDLYGTNSSTAVNHTRIWDGDTIRPFQAKNEINGVAIVLENNTVVNSTMVRVGYPILTHTSGYVISSTPATVSTMWDWRNRPIQLYYVRYLPIQGLSRFSFESYDENHIPERMQATHTDDPTTGQGIISGGWTSRPDHDKHYPEILIPIEAIGNSTFTVASSSSQVIWMDIYIPKTAPPGLYTGTIPIYEGTQLSTAMPIQLTVYPFTMPDIPTGKPFAYLSHAHINWRQGGVPYPNYTTLMSSQVFTRTHYYQELWRHGITPVGDAMQGGCGTDLYQLGPCPEFQIQLDGTLFDGTSGYANAPGVRTPVPVYSMYTYGNWRATAWWPYTSSATCTNANIWVNWFQNHSPKTEYWWYMEDEPADITGTSAIWSTWVSTCPAPGNALKPFTTIRADLVDTEYPNIKAIATTEHYRLASEQDAATRLFMKSNDRRITFYNGYRPGNGSFATEDDGIAPRVTGWVQFKKKFDHYFYWETTNYTHGASVNSDLFNDALTFGYYSSDSATYGRTGFLYENGGGVLLYPGIDTLYPADSYGIDGPMPSWRLKMWRRGINDHTYLTLAAKYDPKAVDSIVQEIIPRVLWERGVALVSDPTYQWGGISWSRDPDVWERARERLAKIISQHR